MISYFSSTLMPLVGSSSSSDARVGGDRHGDVEQLAHALRQGARQGVAVTHDPEPLEGLASAILEQSQRCAAAASTPRRAPRDARRDRHVVEHGERREHLRHLERAARRRAG